MERKNWTLPARMDFKLTPHKSIASASGSQENSNLLPGKVKKFSLDELRDITDNFSDQHILGRGGFGVVYKARLPDGSLVAIKRLLQEKNTPEGIIQFQREVEMISMAVHKNLLRLLGFCITSKERLLVYPFMVNGSVASCLGRSESKPLLDWGRRKHIAYGTALALAYLHDHCRPKIVHRDIKPDNILLDEDMEAVVADFGLARFIDYQDSHVTTEVCGTPGHIAPEYFTSLVCSEKTDVYGYGILLLEILTGKRVSAIMPPSKRDEFILFDWIKKTIKNGKVKMLVDSDLQGNYPSREATELVQVALLCTHRSPKERPEMSKVVRMLEDRGLVEKRKLRTLNTKGFLTNIISFSLSKLQAGTHHFSDENIVGRGSFGNVYKAELTDGSQVAVKRLKNYTQKGELQYQAEILVMKYKSKHPNLLQLLGFCTSGQERLIVYPFFRNGNVASYLRGCSRSSQLDLSMQKKIALGVAKGLAYLHDGCNVSIIHGDVKAENILLDDNFNAVVGDYGRCHFVECEDFLPINAVRGTLGYIAPEYFNTKMASEATDVFAYGVFLLELLIGHRASELFALSFDPLSNRFSEEFSIVNLVRLCLRYVGYIQLNDYGLLQCDVKADTTEQLLQLALLCTQNCSWKRPTMSRIVQILEVDGWEKVDNWRNVMESVQCEWNTPYLLEKIMKMPKGMEYKGKEMQTIDHEWIEAPLFMRKLTSDEKERISHLKHLIKKFPLYEWQRGLDPKMNMFPYLSEENISIYAIEGALPIIRTQFENWFGKRL